MHTDSSNVVSKHYFSFFNALLLSRKQKFEILNNENMT